jgi:hypothetical protein
MYEQAKHECGVRFLCHLRHKKGLAWFRNYISEKNFSQALLNDYYDQWKLGNKGEWEKWILKNSSLQQQGLGI